MASAPCRLGPRVGSRRLSPKKSEGWRVSGCSNDNSEINIPTFILLVSRASDRPPCLGSHTHTKTDFVFLFPLSSSSICRAKRTEPLAPSSPGQRNRGALPAPARTVGPQAPTFHSLEAAHRRRRSPGTLWLLEAGRWNAIVVLSPTHQCKLLSTHRRLEPYRLVRGSVLPFETSTRRHAW